MLWVKQSVILVAIALVTANAQCVARCALKPCHGDDASTTNVPPCHRHHPPGHQPTQSDAPRPCVLSFLAIGDRAAAPMPAFDHQHSPVLGPIPPAALHKAGDRQSIWS